MLVSQVPYLHLIPCWYATIFIGFGVLWFVNGPKAISFFEVPYPDPIKDKDNPKVEEFKKTMDVISVVYGIRDIYMGATLFVGVMFGTRQVLGWITFAAGVVAAVDGWACKRFIGKGHMNHWSYAPHLVALGLILAGALDVVPIDNIAQLW